MALDLEARKGKIGSSDIGAVCGLNPFRTPLQVWAEMTGKVKPDEENDFMWLGTQLEDTVAKFWQKKNEGSLVTKDARTFTHKKLPFACATPDYRFSLPDRAGILECKTTGSHNKQRWLEGLPDYIHCQVMWQMGVTEEAQTIIACLCDRELITHEINYDSTVFDQLADKASSFMEMVKADTPPPALGPDKDLLVSLQGNPEPTRIAEFYDDEATVMIESYLKMDKKKKEKQEQLKLIESSMKDFQARIIQKMGGAGIAYFPGGQIKFTRSVVPEKTVRSYEMFRFTVMENRK